MPHLFLAPIVRSTPSPKGAGLVFASVLLVLSLLSAYQAYRSMADRSIAVTLIGIGAIFGALAWLAMKASDSGESKFVNCWHIDFSSATLTPPSKTKSQQPVRVLAAEHSIGCYLASTEPPCYLIELRHCRRGPIGELAWVQTGLTAGQMASDLRWLDATVDVLAQRLKIKRSGAPLIPGS